MPDLRKLADAVARPWTVALDGSLWIGSGHYPDDSTFEDCLLRCIPRHVHGTDAVAFEVLLYCQTQVVMASAITSAREVLLVYGDDPLQAVDLDDQPTVDQALADRGLR